MPLRRMDFVGMRFRSLQVRLPCVSSLTVLPSLYQHPLHHLREVVLVRGIEIGDLRLVELLDLDIGRRRLFDDLRDRCFALLVSFRWLERRWRM